MAHDVLAPDLSSLAALARDGNVDMRPVILRVRTDLFLVAPTRPPDLLSSFTSLATGLIPIVDAETVAVVARKLARHPDTPMEVIECLLARGGEIAAIVLSLSPHIPRRVLEEIVAREPTALVLAVAARTNLDGRLVERIIERNEPVLDERLVQNATIQLQPAMLDTLIARARSEKVLASLLATRTDIGGADKASLYAHADPDARDTIVRDMTRLAELDGRSRIRRRLNAEDTALLVGAAAEADKPTFVTALAALLNTSAMHTAELVNEATGELLALSLVTIGVVRQDAVRIFLTLDPAIARSVERVFGLSDLMQRVRQPVAARIVDAVLGRVSTPSEQNWLERNWLEKVWPEKAVYVPAMAPSGTPSRPSPAPMPGREEDDRRIGPERQAG